MLTGRQKIEAAFSPEGTPSIPAVIPYEGIFLRDHWNKLTDCPWWYAYSPKVEDHLAYLSDAIERIGQDWFQLPDGPSPEEQENRRIDHRAEGTYLVVS